MYGYAIELGLYGKTRATAAAGGCVRIVDLECGADQLCREINFRAGHEFQAHFID